MIKLIVTDMDGTLLNEKEELNTEFLKVFKELKEKNILFAVASGRQRKNLELKFSEIKDDLIMLFENGSCCSLNGETLYKSELNKTLVHKFIDLGRKNSHNMLLCTEDMTYIENVNEEFITELRKYCDDVTFVNDLKEIDKPIVKFTIFDPIGAKENSFKTYEGLFGSRVKVSVSTDKWLHIINKEVSKGFGVQALQKHFNITPEETMVFGDGLNDLEMIKSAKYSYAMGNAIEELKAAANFIAPSNNDNGVLEVIKNKILIEEVTPIETKEKDLDTILENILSTDDNSNSTLDSNVAEVVEEVAIMEDIKEEKTKKKATTKKITTKKEVTKESTVEKTPSSKAVKDITEQENDLDEFDSLDDEKHPFDDESLEERLLAILG